MNADTSDGTYLLTGLNVHSSLLRLIKDGGKWGDGYLCPTTYTQNGHHQNDSALRWAAVWDILMFHQLCGQSHKTVSINHHFWRERRAEADRTAVLLLTNLESYRLTARPHRLTKQDLTIPHLTTPHLATPHFKYVPAGSPSRDVTVYVWHKPTELAHSFLFCSCIYFCLFGPFNCFSFHKFFRQLSIFWLCSSGLISLPYWSI